MANGIFCDDESNNLDYRDDWYLIWIGKVHVDCDLITCTCCYGYDGNSWLNLCPTSDDQSLQNKHNGEGGDKEEGHGDPS